MTAAATVTAGEPTRRRRRAVASRPRSRRTGSRRRIVAAARARGSSSGSAVAALSGDVVAARQPAAAAGRAVVGWLLAAVVPALADEAALVEPQLRARPRAAARHPRVRRLALRAYRGYGRYLVELMRLPSHAARGAHRAGAGSRRSTRSSGSGARPRRRRPDHRGRPRRQQRGRRRRRSPTTACRSASWPTIRRSRRSSSSSARQREAWGVKIIAVAQPARDLRRCCGGARCSDCSSTGATAPTASRCASSGRGRRCRPARRRSPPRPGRGSCRSPIRRQPDGTFHVSWPAPIDVASSDPAELQRATQAIADALAATIAARPDQWYSFKPMWPATAEEAADLERRAALCRPARPDPGPARDRLTMSPTERRTRASRVRGRLARATLRRCRGSPAACPRGRWSRWPSSPATSGTGPRPERAAQARRNLRRVATWLAAHDRGTPRSRAAAHRPAGARAPRPARPTATRRATTSRSRGRPVSGRQDLEERIEIETPGRHRRRVHARSAVDLRRAPFRRDRAAGLFLAVRVGGAVGADGDARRPGPAGLVRPDPRGGRHPDRRCCARPAASSLAALRDGTSVGLVGDRDLTGGGTLTELFGAPARLPLGPGAARRSRRGAPLYVAACAAPRPRPLPRSARARRRPGRGLAPRDGDADRRSASRGPSSGSSSDAPEQWWAVFFPIWPDLEAAAPERIEEPTAERAA